MRFEPFYDESPVRPVPYHLTHRLKVLLSLWTSPLPWQRHDAGWPYCDAENPTFASVDEAKLWISFIERAQPVEPVSTSSGLDDAIRRHNLACGDDQSKWSRDILQENGIAQIDGARAAIRSKGPTITSGIAWRLSLQCDDEEAERLDVIGRKIFEQVDRFSGEISVDGVSIPVQQGASALARVAIGIIDGEELLNLWRKATALGVVETWIELLESRQRDVLASKLTDELLAVEASLGWRTDLKLDDFSKGCARPLAPTMFASRLDEAFWVQPILEQWLPSLAPKYVFGQMASGVILAGSSVQIGNLLRALPLGRAYFDAIETLRRRRPSQIAPLLAHVDFAPDAMIAMVDWPDKFSVQGEGSLVARDEWSEVVRLSRWLVLFQDRDPDYRSVLALSAHDEKRDRASKKNSYKTPPAPSVAMRMEPWRARLTTAEQVCRAVDEAERRLCDEPSDDDLIVSLRILELIEKAHPMQATRLAAAITDAYCNRFVLKEDEPKEAPRLARYGELLGVLDRVARGQEVEVGAQWRTPFDIELFVRRSHEDVPAEITSKTVVTKSFCAWYVHAHAEHLLAAADAASPAERIELAECFVQLFEQTHGKMGIDPWSWNRRDEDEVSPQLVRFADLLNRLPEPEKEKDKEAALYLDRLRDANATELHWAELLWGLKRGSPLAGQIEPRTRRRAESLLQRNDLERGYANALGVALYYAEMPELAEQYASYVLASFEGQDLHHRAPVRDLAIQVLMASWSAQQKWTEIDNAKLALSDPNGQILAENLRAVTEIKRGKTDEALSRLNRILEREPSNAMALTNITAAYAERKDWQACLAACARARDVLNDKILPEVYANKAQAYYHLQDFRNAVAALDSLPAEMARSPEMIRLRVSLVTNTVPAVSRINDDLRLLEKTDKASADILRASLAPLSDAELGGAWFASTSLHRRFVSFEDRCRLICSDGAEMYVVKNIAAAAQKITAQPSLACELSEDHLTRLLCILLDAFLNQVRINAEFLDSGGWGPKREGLADFTLWDRSEYELKGGRCIVRGEAKKWRGPEWMKQGMQQIFGTSNTGQEIFLALVVYSDNVEFEGVVNGVKDALSCFGSEAPTPFGTLEAPEPLKIISGTSVRVFKTRHSTERDDGDSPVRTLYTFVVDILSEPSRAVRQLDSNKSRKRKSGK